MFLKIFHTLIILPPIPPWQGEQTTADHPVKSTQRIDVHFKYWPVIAPFQGGGVSSARGEKT